jgi:hypothetical protein
MNSVILALIGVVAAQDSASICTSHDDCEKNFDAIYAEWEAGEEPDPEAEPVAGGMKCANSLMSGTDEESGEEFTDVALSVCTLESACAGWEGEVAGTTVKITDCNMAGASKLAAGFAAMVVAAYAM